MRLLLLGLVGCATLGFVVLEYVRGEWVVAIPAPQLESALIAMSTGGPEVRSQGDLMMIGAVAARLTLIEQRSPGQFRVAFRDRLDDLERLRHLVHGPFTGIRRMYCDVWINSLTTYGTEEPTWGFTAVRVRPARRLPILLFLLDRLGRGRTTWQEHVGAVPEAIGGMEMHTLGGRGRLWSRLLRLAASSPRLAMFITAQLSGCDRDWSDDLEVRFWDELSARPSVATLELLAAGPLEPMQQAPAQDPRKWADSASRVIGEMVAASGHSLRQRGAW